MIFELLEDPAYRHILLNHLPITGLMISFAVLVTGAALRQSALLRVGLVLVALTAGSSGLVEMTGDDAHPAIFDRLDGDGRAWLDYHTELADTWLPVLYANAGLAALALGLGFARPQYLLSAALVVALMTVAGIGTAAWIGEVGGKIKHPEFRLEDPPVLDSPRRLR